MLVVGQTPISELSHEIPGLQLKTLLWAGAEADMPAGDFAIPFFPPLYPFLPNAVTLKIQTGCLGLVMAQSETGIFKGHNNCQRCVEDR